jgi:hypothetical protein
MTRKRKRRSAVVEIGTVPAKVRIYTINRRTDSISSRWHGRVEAGGAPAASPAMDEAKMVGQQITVRLINGGTEACEATFPRWVQEARASQ